MYIFGECSCGTTNLLVHGIHQIALPGHQTLHFGQKEFRGVLYGLEDFDLA